MNNFLKQKLNINFNNIKLYEEAFTHISLIHELKIKTNCYERLEFLGDSIIGQIVATYIFKNFENMKPGDMSLLRSRVVRRESLSEISKKLKFRKYIKTGKGEINSKELPDSIYEDVFESLVGAIYLDLGFKEAKKFVENHLCEKIKLTDIDDLKDYKTKLQELTHSESGKSVKYIIVKDMTIKNDLLAIKKEFFVNVKFNDNNNDLILGKGSGKSIKEAEQKAAKNAYEKMVIK